MLRRIHSVPGLIAALLLAVLAISGAVLSLEPGIERLGTTVPPDGEISVALLAERVAAHFPGVEQIQRSSSGTVVVYYSQNGHAGAERIDPATGQGIGAYAPSGFYRWVKNLHRSFLADTPGRVVAGLSAVAMLVLCFSGLMLLAKRVGGWRHIMGPMRGDFGQRWHARLGRVAVSALLLSASTGIYLSAVTFGLVPDGTQDGLPFPGASTTGPAGSIGTLSALRATDLNDLRELVYPSPGSPDDFYSLLTAKGEAYVDQTSGRVVSYQAHSGVQQAYEWIYQLHTGKGLWWLGLLLGLSVLSVPFMAVTGVKIWWQRHQSIPRVKHNTAPQSADCVILVGSEGNSTWGFANTLHDALRQAGLRVHTAPMNRMASRYRQASQLFILTATYGDGDAPSSASRFLERLDRFSVEQQPRFAVLGFGDRQYPQFCRFARDVQGAMLARGWRPLLDIHTVDRKSTQEFERWGDVVGKRMGKDLALVHVSRFPRTRALQLVSRADYGAQVLAPTSILRFGPVAAKGGAARLRQWIGLNRLPRFEAGDLVGIVPPGSTTPRFYSLASGSKDGVMEICVRKLPGGLCSQMLHGLAPGQHINAFIQPNPGFRPASGTSPVILVGAGAGIGPLAGFIRNNTGRHAMYLFWGGRDPASDFLYEPELGTYLADGRLTELHAVFSRVQQGGYVQERVLDNATKIRELIESGGQVLVCGSRAMATSIREAMDRILAPAGLDVNTLKRQGRYREDAF
ncbi:PepSY domain-containing protein [Arenimonas alkanexedens]